MFPLKYLFDLYYIYLHYLYLYYIIFLTDNDTFDLFNVKFAK